MKRQPKDTAKGAPATNFVDPLRELVDRLQKVEAELNASVGPAPAEAAAFDMLSKEIGSANVKATSFPGAMAALRQARAEFDGSTSTRIVEPLIKGGLAYFDNIEASTGDALANAVTMSADLDIGKVVGHDWVAIYEALTLAIKGIGATTSQPGGDDKGEVLNAAGEYINAVESFLLYERRRVVAAAKASVPKDWPDWDAVSNVLLQHEMEDGGRIEPVDTDIGRKQGSCGDESA
jgi:hypothetical protein